MFVLETRWTTAQKKPAEKKEETEETENVKDCDTMGFYAELKRSADEGLKKAEKDNTLQIDIVLPTSKDIAGAIKKMNKASDVKRRIYPNQGRRLQRQRIHRP
jgi:hypothetical protein